VSPTATRSTVKRHPERASYDRPSVHAVLDAAPMGHLGFVVDGQPFVIPMLYGRIDDAVYLHGSVASRLMRTTAGGVEVCLTVTVVDGLVLARSAFHHSMNYRSAVLFGRAVPVDGDEKVAALKAISDQLRPGRWEEVREPNPTELRMTSVLRLDVEDASAKVRAGGPIDEPEDLDLTVWAGVIPCELTWGTPVADGAVPA
jgi:nitroimidazol reductase NimA-like FMN-containing flavoprotein (pyridoxamine 5'-phosphate oxidase superfamily)